MKRTLTTAATLTALMLVGKALASEAETSANASSNRFDRNGTASATARHDGRIGFSRTESESGAVNTARGVAVGFDENGLSLSVSNAIAPRIGPGLATNFNLSIDRDGNVAHSSGVSVADGPLSQAVSAGGQTGTGYRSPHATSVASGRSDPYGQANATTHSGSSVSRPVGVMVRPPTVLPRSAPVMSPRSRVVRHVVSGGHRAVRVVRVRR